MDNVKAPRKTKEEKIALLQQQLADRERLAIEYRQKMQARIDLIEARGTAQDRKDQTRRKILLGAMLYDRIEKRKFSNQKLIDWMNDYLIRDDDRALFNLAPIDKNAISESDKTAISEMDSPDHSNHGIEINETKPCYRLCNEQN